VVKTDAAKQTTAVFFSATEPLLPAIDAIFAHAIESRRRVQPSPFCAGGKDLHHESNGRFEMGKGGWLVAAKARAQPAPGYMVRGAPHWLV